MSSISDKPDPVVLRITVEDVVEAFGKGLRDFQTLPLYDIGLGAVYAIGGLVIVYSITALRMSYLAYPLAAGFALIAPFVATGFYELSRQRERGHPPSAREALTAIITRVGLDGLRHDFRIHCVDVPSAVSGGTLPRPA
jgi:uncharacterized membrane protein